MFKRLDKLAGSVANWSAVYVLVGGGALVTGALAWAASTWEAVSSQGWGAIAFAGVGGACAVLIALGISLMGWRVFRPLPPPSAVATPDNLRMPSEGAEGRLLEGQSNVVSIPEFDRRIDRLKLELAPQDHQETIAAMRNDVGEAHRLIRDLAATGSTQHEAVERIKGQLAAHERAIGSIPSQTTMAGFAEAILTLMSISLFDHLIKSAPPIEEREPTAAFHLKAMEYLQQVLASGLANQRLSLIQTAMENAKGEAESLLKLCPPPLAGADLLNHREWAISVRQVATVVMVLERMKRDSEESFRQLRPFLTR